MTLSFVLFPNKYIFNLHLLTLLLPFLSDYLGDTKTIRPFALKGHVSIARSASPHGLLTRSPLLIISCLSKSKLCRTFIFPDLFLLTSKVKVKALIFTRLARKSQLELRINLWPSKLQLHGTEESQNRRR